MKGEVVVRSVDIGEIVNHHVFHKSVISLSVGKDARQHILF
jgi:hypothetical protein